MSLTVDVLIPVYKPDKKFQILLSRLCRQSYPISRIIVINTDKSLYPSDEIKEPDNMELHHIEKDEFDHGTTRGWAARLSTADLMLFMTQDAIPADKNLVARLAEAFEDESIGAAYARQLPRKEHSLIEKYTRHFNYPPESFVKTEKDLDSMGIKTFFCSDSCAMYRKSAYRELGGFLPDAIFNEDMLLASQLIYAGYGIA